MTWAEFKAEADELYEESKHGFTPPAKWLAELMWMKYIGEVNETTAVTLLNEYRRRRRELFEELVRRT